MGVRVEDSETGEWKEEKKKRGIITGLCGRVC